jgi:hypothetical protein
LGQRREFKTCCPGMEQATCPYPVRLFRLHSASLRCSTTCTTLPAEPSTPLNTGSGSQSIWWWTKGKDRLRPAHCFPNLSIRPIPSAFRQSHSEQRLQVFCTYWQASGHMLNVREGDWRTSQVKWEGSIPLEPFISMVGSEALGWRKVVI